MAILATLHMPDPNPVGPPSILAAMVVVFFASLTTGLIPLPPAIRRNWTIAAPIVVFGMLVATWYLPSRFLDADHFAAWIVCVVAGFFFALQNLRYTSLGCRVNAAVFSLVFGAGVVFLAVAWESGHESAPMYAALVFGMAWVGTALLLLWRLPKGWRLFSEPEDPDGPVRFQFTLRGLLAGVAAVAMVFSLGRAMLDFVKRERLSVDDIRLRQGLYARNDVLLTILDYDKVEPDNVPTSGGRIVEYAEYATQGRRDLVAYLQSAGLDFAEMDANEAVLFWLSGVPRSATSTSPIGGNTGRRVPVDWAGLLQHGFFDADTPNLVDRDGDGWPEYVFESWGPEYPEKVFRLEDGRIVAWDTLADEATGIRKGYALDEKGELTSFDVVEDTP